MEIYLFILLANIVLEAPCFYLIPNGHHQVYTEELKLELLNGSFARESRMLDSGLILQNVCILLVICVRTTSLAVLRDITIPERERAPPILLPDMRQFVPDKLPAIRSLEEIMAVDRASEKHLGFEGHCISKQLKDGTPCRRRADLRVLVTGRTAASDPAPFGRRHAGTSGSWGQSGCRKCGGKSRFGNRIALGQLLKEGTSSIAAGKYTEQGKNSDLIVDLHGFGKEKIGVGMRKYGERSEKRVVGGVKYSFLTLVFCS